MFRRRKTAATGTTGIELCHERDWHDYIQTVRNRGDFVCHECGSRARLVVYYVPSKEYPPC